LPPTGDFLGSESETESETGDGYVSFENGSGNADCRVSIETESGVHPPL